MKSLYMKIMYNIAKSVGTPQESVVSPVLFILFTNDCRCDNVQQYMIKFADDAALADLTNSELEADGEVSKYETEVRRFVSWCKDNFLELNVGKTEEVIFDFRTSGTTPDPLVIDGQTVRRVEAYKYLGTIIDAKLRFNENTDRIYKKAQSRLYMLRKLRSFGVSENVLKLFYHSFIESLLTFSFLV